jgi:murein DD-endopeptidase MepM/ murein hydrolase activator NlpD
MDYRSSISREYRYLGGTNLSFRNGRRRRGWPAVLALTAAVLVGVGLMSNLADAARESARSAAEVPPPALPALPPLQVQAAAPESAAGASGMAEPPAGMAGAGEPAVAEAAPVSTAPDAAYAPVAQPVAPTEAPEPDPAAAQTLVQPPSAETPDPAEPRTEGVVVEKGDTLGRIFERIGVGRAQMHELLATPVARKHLTSLRPGEVVELRYSETQGLLGLEYHYNDFEYLAVEKSAAGYKSRLLKEDYERRVTTASGVIRTSLFQGAQDAGLPDPLIMRMVEILGWDIDFALDIQPGDRLTVLYEEYHTREGKKVRDGHILAVEFVNRGKAVRAVRYVDPQGVASYYSPAGNAMRKAFLRTPVKFSRISSGFSQGRLHPVLSTVRAHKGVDYAAPTGTPVKAVGDARVVFLGQKGGYGNVIMLEHAGRYTTVYGHLSRYAPGIRASQRVAQGDVIGYVGQTGLATGPHLHYEFRIDGVHRDPLTVKLPKSLPIESRYLADFKRKTTELVAGLDQAHRTRLALNER